MVVLKLRSKCEQTYTNKEDTLHRHVYSGQRSVTADTNRLHYNDKTYSTTVISAVVTTTIPLALRLHVLYSTTVYRLPDVISIIRPT